MAIKHYTHKRMVHWHEWDWETLAMPTTLPSEGERQPKTCIRCQNGLLTFMKCIWNILRMFQLFEPHTGVLIECIQPTLDTHAHIKMWCQQVTHEIIPQRNLSIYAWVCSILLVRTVWAHSGVPSLSWNETPDPLIRERERGTFHSDLFNVAAFTKQLTHQEESDIQNPSKNGTRKQFHIGKFGTARSHCSTFDTQFSLASKSTSLTKEYFRR